MKKKFILILSIVTFLLSGCNSTADKLLQKDEVILDQEEVAAEADWEMDMDDTADAHDQSDVTEEAKESDDTDIFVYICGAVQHPGVYELKPGSRIFQLVNEAGGLAEDADERSVNLAEPVEDGQMVRIYTEEEMSQMMEIGEITDANGLDFTTADVVHDGKININTADTQQLQTLSGIGESKATDIVAYRESVGSFQSTEDIMNVSGIGQSTYDKIKDYISVK